MFKKILSLVMLSVSGFMMSAQTPLPLNPEVKHGTLPNGLNYYILHNEEPKQRANFYIAQKVGSTLETPEQLGLAHFLEHMAFNGTKHYPGKDMLKYLQSKGIRFGEDINAYTAFDETVYRINNVPTSDKALMDSVLLVLYDWSGSILLEESEINAERGVIEEEWRSRNTAEQRMYEAMLPQIYKEYQYQQMPIGKMEVVKNFPPQAIRDYYKKWYRPDQQGIVIVGDFDAAEMEKKVVALFSEIPMPENAAERTYPTVSDNKEPIYFYFSDKELRFPLIQVYFKSDPFPVELRNTLEYYLQDDVMENLLAQMINNRLDEYSKNPDCKYAYAGVGFDSFLVSKTKDAFAITILAKDDVKAAYNDALSIVARACKTGFAESELVRSRDELLASYEKAYNERNNTNSHALGQELCRHFVDNEPAPGIETEYELVKQILPMIPVSAFNEVSKEILTPENQVIVVSVPEKEGMSVVTGEEMIADLNNALNTEYEAYVDEVVTDPLIQKLPKPGKIKSEANGKFDTKVLYLSNGVKVVVKPTDYKSDQILFTAFKKGGKNLYAGSDASNVLFAGDAYDYSRLGKFDQITLGKYLAGKKVSLSYSLGSYTTLLSGSSTVKDLPTFMEVLYATFTDVNPDEKSFAAGMDQSKSMLANMESNPNYIFRIHNAEACYSSPLMQMPTLETLSNVNYKKSLSIFKNSVKNAADYTFIFTGNVDVDSIRPLLEQYVATLPSKGKPSGDIKALSNLGLNQGQISDVFTFPMQVPSTMVFSGISQNNMAFNITNDIMIEMIGDVLSNIYTDTLREEEGGTYSPYAYANLNPFTSTWQINYVFQTNADMKDKLIKRANEELMNLLQNGADEAHFAKVKEAAVKQCEIEERTNEYWNNGLRLLGCGFNTLSDRKAAIQSITLSQFNQFMKNLYNGNNKIEVVMEGVAAQ